MLYYEKNTIWDEAMKIWVKQHSEILSLACIAIIMYLFWLFPFLSYRDILSSSIRKPMEIIILIASGLSAALLTYFKKSSYWLLAFVAFIPFVFAHPFDANTVPWALYVAGGLAILGVIATMIRMRLKWKIGPFFFGLVALGASCLLGGFGKWEYYFWPQLVIVFFVVGGILFLYIFLSSMPHISVRKFAWIMVALGLFISLQSATYWLSSSNIKEALLTKHLTAGWGISNNIAVILLLLIPFLFYFMLQSRKWKSVLFMILAVGEMGIIGLSYSRGGIAAMVVMAIFAYIYCAIKTKEKKWYFISSISILLVFAILFIIFRFCYPGAFKRMIDLLFSRLEGLNGRIPIYKAFLRAMKKNFMFGNGLFGPFYFSVDVGQGAYQWGHDTLLHTFYTLGLTGILAIFYHFYEKYMYLWKTRKSVFSVMVFLSFFGSGLYGLIDISYFFINYMVLLILILAILPNQEKEMETCESSF